MCLDDLPTPCGWQCKQRLKGLEAQGSSKQCFLRDKSRSRGKLWCSFINLEMNTMVFICKFVINQEENLIDDRVYKFVLNGRTFYLLFKQFLWSSNLNAIANLSKCIPCESG